MKEIDNNFQKGRITEVTIKGFRSIKSVDNLKIPQLSVLIGANGVGKSSFIKFFEMIGWMLRSQRLQEFIIRKGGGDDQLFMGSRMTEAIDAEIAIETGKGRNEYRFTMAHLPAYDTLILTHEAYRFSAPGKGTDAAWTTLKTFSRESELPVQTNKTAKTICSLLKQCATYQFHDTSEKALILQRWDILDCMRLRSDGGNLAAVLLELKENDFKRYRLIVRQIQRVFPTLDDFVLEPVSGKVLLQWRSRYSDKLFGAHLTSDGSLRLFCLITLLNLPDERLPNVLFFDEPELGLHPHAITLVSEMMKRVAETRQVFIATQSPYMVDCFSLENIIVAEARDGSTVLKNLPIDKYKAWLDDEYLVSDIWLKSPIGGEI